MPGHHFGVVVCHFQVGVGRPDHPADVSTIGEIDGLVALGIIHGIAGAGHIVVGEIDPVIAVNMGVGDVCQLVLPPPTSSVIEPPI